LAAGEELTYPTYRVSIAGAPQAQVTLTAYGYMAELARQAMLKLAYEEELFVELIVPTRLAHLIQLRSAIQSRVPVGWSPLKKAVSRLVGALK